MRMNLKQYVLMARPRVVWFGVLCILLLAGLVACQPKSAQPDDAAASGQSQQAEAAAEQSAPPVSGKDPLTDAEYAKAVTAKGPEFTEAELVKVFKDMEPVSRGSMDEVINHLDAEKGWDRTRAYYILTKVAAAEIILEDESNREYIARDWPEDIPTAKELALVQKHRATLHKLIGYEKE